MRVIRGEAKGRRLKGPPGPLTRPMQDKIKEALFSVLESQEVEAGRVLDLYAGTGAIGIEALSRGADWVDFVEQQKAAAAVIRWNLEHTRLAGRARIHTMPVIQYLRRREPPYDLIFLDPPYADPHIAATLTALSESKLVESGTVIALGHWPQFDEAIPSPRLELIRRRCHGDSCFSVFRITDEMRPAE
jgi:16S rRNA (guanine966-N2)-methyltransferase